MKKIVVWILCLMMLATFAACGGKGGAGSTGAPAASGGGTASQGAAEGGAAAEAPQGEKIFKWVSGSRDTCINPHDANAMGNLEIVDLLVAPLYHYAVSEDRLRAEVRPCLALGEPESEDGVNWTIHLNPEAKWANGEAITADTFMYSWKMALDPQIMYSTNSAVAEMYVAVVNAKAYYTQASDKTTVAWEDVGFKKIDEHTLSVTTDQKYTVTDMMRHFAQRCTAPVYEPMYEAGMNEKRSGTNYGTSLENYMCSGMFVITEWTKGSKAVLEKNDNYIFADDIKVDGVTRRVVVDEATRLELFESGESDYVNLGTNGLAKYGEDERTVSYDQKTIRMLEVNLANPEKEILQDATFRKALYYAIDRGTIAKLALATPATFFISGAAIIYSDGTRYRDLPEATDWLPANNGYDPALAKKYFDEAMAAHNLTSIELSISYTESYDHLRVSSEYLQNQLPKVFGEDKVKVTLQAMSHDALLDMMKNTQSQSSTDWDLCWSGRFPAAETFQPFRKFSYYRSTDVGRYANYTNTFLDESYPLFLTDDYRFDEQKMKELTVEVEKSIILDNVTVIPVFQEKGNDIFSDRIALAVDGYINTLGWAWMYADIVE